jgi:hypothetical protein
MKKSILALIGVAVVTGSLFTGCKKDTEEDTPPSVVIQQPAGGAITVEPNEEVDVSVLASAANESRLKTFKVEFSQDGGPFTALGDTTFASSTTAYTFEAPLTSKSTPGTVAYRFTATDNNSLSTSATLTITVENGSSGGAIESYEAKMLGNQSSSTGSFLSTSTGTVYTQADAKANASSVDLLYFHGASNGPTIASPNDADAASVYSNSSTGLQTWSTKNATQLYASSMTAAQFEAITTDTEIVAAATGAASTKISQLTVGKVFAFTTAAGKKGLVKVNSITGTNSTPGEISVDVKVQL